MLFTVLAVSLAATFLELKSMIRQHYVREIVLTSVLFTIGAGLLILWMLNIKLPTPLNAISFVFKPVAQFVEYVLS